MTGKKTESEKFPANSEQIRINFPGNNNNCPLPVLSTGDKIRSVDRESDKSIVIETEFKHDNVF